MGKCHKYYDTCDYPEGVYGISRVNKKNLGLTKDEFRGRLNNHFVRLRSKMYSYRIGDEPATEKLK
ncbi:hypothetical protein HHI36_000744, partial [Cryptolaemus montrouzieri]